MNTYQPTGQLTFDSVESIRVKIFEKIPLNKDEDFQLNLSLVEACDSAGLALLLDLKKHLAKQGQRLIIVAMPEDGKNLAAFYGLEDLLLNPASMPIFKNESSINAR